MTSTTSETVSKEQLSRAIGRIASGVYIVTLVLDGQRDGMLTTFLSQTSFEPPMLIFAVKKERPILKELADGRNLAVNVLSKNNMDVFKNFAKPHTEGLDRFENLAVDKDEFGSPIFRDAVAYLSCAARKHVDSGDHVLIVAEILAGSLLQGDSEPMVHLRKNGFGY
jgi:3-hydroxy-9,10-secoandrosta-1,3,5(10)-triene-9,17-dione monooxygenase reductase component